MTRRQPAHDHQSIDDESLYIIAEAGSNHDGSLSTALHLVEAAAGAGANAVKFQLFRSNTLYPRNAGIVDTPIGKRDLSELFEGLEVPLKWLNILSDAAQQADIAFLCTPFDTQLIQPLVDIGVTKVKIASPELTHLPLLRAASSTGLPLLLSTGMASLAEVEEALETVGHFDNSCDVTLLQCTTAYPCPENQANLAAIETMRAAFSIPVGLSDHTLDPLAAPLVAAWLGAPIVEKHFTLSRSGRGPDHPFAIEPAALTELVTTSRSFLAVDPPERYGALIDLLGKDRVEALLGSSLKRVADAEEAARRFDRRSIHAIRDIEPGERISTNGVAILRGESNLRPGMHPRYWDLILGARVQRHISTGQGVEWADIIDLPNGTGTLVQHREGA